MIMRRRAAKKRSVFTAGFASSFGDRETSRR
jgi:hypothetical protein